MDRQPRFARPGWPAAVIGSTLGTAAAVGLMFWARSVYQVRTLPERLLEWVLLFVPLDAFERGLQSFGAEAKVLALDLTTALMILVLVAAGTLAVRRGAAAVGATALGLWLFAMGVVMPVTGAGFFASGLFQGALLTNASYLGLAWAYAAVLLLARWAIAERAPRPHAPAGQAVSRRAALGAAAGTAAAYALTFWLGRSGGSSGSALPVASLADLPTPSEAPPTPAPTVAPTATAEPALSAAPSPAPTATPPPSPPTPTPPPAPAQATAPVPPPPERTLARAEDGTVTGSGRKPGELAPLFTPNDLFYITTKNAVSDPVVDPRQWRLVLDGEVAKPVQLDLRLLYQLPAVEVVKTLECISNRVARCGEAPFGCDAIGNARWKGARLRDVLALAGGLKPGVRSIVFAGADEFTAALPPDPGLLDDALLVYEMNGQVLPIEHGYPARVLVPNRYGMKGAKWVVNIRPVTSVAVDR